MKKEEFKQLCWSTRARLVMSDLRIMPRGTLLAYLWFGYEIGVWFMGIGVEATTQQTTFVSTYALAFPAVLGLYAGTGNKKQEM